MSNTIDWKPITNDSVGTPRFVCHFLRFITQIEQNDLWKVHGINTVSFMYRLALSRSKQFGGKKFHNKQYGGGIVFSTWDLMTLENHINNLMKSIKNEES